MSEKSDKSADRTDRKDLALRELSAPELGAEPVAPSGGGGMFGVLGRASSSALKVGREMTGSAQRITRQFVSEAEHLVDIALTEPETRPIVHGEVVEQPEETTALSGLSTEELRTRGDRLVTESARARTDERPHPAFEHVLAQLAPDETRILRLVLRDGAQAAVDVRTNRPFGVGSELVAAGLSMISEVAGLRYPDRAPAYLGNLHRLGLIWFSKEQVDTQKYELLQVQPNVVEAVGKAGRYAKVIRRRIEITPFGRDFCRTCFNFA